MREVFEVPRPRVGAELWLALFSARIIHVRV